MRESPPLPQPVQIRPLEARDQVQWRSLYRHYAQFYRSPMTDAILERSWSWLMAPQHPVEGMVAESADQRLVGLAHFRACPDPLIAQDVGYLDDLFVAPEQRGAGTGRSLIMAVATIAQERGWPVVRWVTAETNAPARRLYDQLAQATAWVTYDLSVPR